MKARETAAYVAAGLIVTSLVGWAALRTSGAPNAPTVASRPQPVAASQSLDSVRRIPAAELRGRMDRGEVLVIDVRDVDSYLESHLPSALHIPLSFIASELQYLPRSKPIVTYCTWPAEETSARAVLILENGGIESAALLGGFDAWRTAGFPVRHGLEP